MIILKYYYHLTLISVISLVLFINGCASQHGYQFSEPTGWYSVKAGDTLYRIAQNNHIPLVRLQRFNPDTIAGTLVIGQQLRLPDQQERAPATGSYRYRIRSQDTLSNLARWFHTSVTAIKHANHLIDSQQIAMGQLITIPVKTTSHTISTNYKPNQQVILPADLQSWSWPLQDFQIERPFGINSRGQLEPMLLSAPAQKVTAIASGTVSFAAAMRQLGNVVIVHHANDIQSVYAQCGKMLVYPRQNVITGTPICQLTTNQGKPAKLILDLRRYGRPFDPQRLLRQR